MKIRQQYLIENMKVFCGRGGIYIRDGERIIDEKDPRKLPKTKRNLIIKNDDQRVGTGWKRARVNQCGVPQWDTWLRLCGGC